MLGPLSLLLTFTATSLPLPLAASSMVGVCLAWRWRVRGFFFALLPMGGALYSCENGLHYLAALSLLLGVWITALSAEELNEKRAQLEHAREEAECTNDKEEQAVLLSSFMLCKKECEELSRASKASSQESEQLVGELKEQCTERDQQLFHMESALLALQKREELSALELSEEQALLFNCSSAYAAECAALQEEVAALEQLVSALVAPKRGPKKEKEASLQLDLLTLGAVDSL